MPPVIRIENLAKHYRITHGIPRGHYRTFRDTLTDLAAAPLRRLRGQSNGRVEEFWALKDVNLQVQQGEVVGIIGRNGAGKSTLLKILSRITAPTTGRVELHGRVGSLLEVGTGFHPELTGRENIYLNGSILGMHRREIQRKFDEIVDFSGVERFLDTPVKRYSSGMYVRLAFAVAAHLEPEILFVDEVLAVGDMAFQKKCLGKMQDISAGGRTILFVSHNMAAVESLCSRAAMVDGGRIVLIGECADVTQEYCRRMRDASNNGTKRFGDCYGSGIIRNVSILDDSGKSTDAVPLGGRLHILVRLQASQPIESPTIGVGIDDTHGKRHLTVHTPLQGATVTHISKECDVHCIICPMPLVPGDYLLKIAISQSGNQIAVAEQALCFTVMDANAFGEGRGFHRGLCVAPSHWYVTDPNKSSVDSLMSSRGEI
ncbi:MAG: ABC transporter ATP-binding protein [Pirellulales bacterium]